MFDVENAQRYLDKAWPNGHMEITKFLARGTSGYVFECIKNDGILSSPRPDAVKFIRIDVTDEEAVSEGKSRKELLDEKKRRASMELETAALLTSAYAVRYKDYEMVGDDDGFVLIIRMPKFKTLSVWLKENEDKDSAFAEEMADKMLRQIGDVLLECEQKKIVHRDIKPENLFVSENNDFYLGDFGIAKSLVEGSHPTLLGTAYYAAPEVTSGEGADYRSDQYSLGIVAYLIANHGRAPFEPPYPGTISRADEQNALIQRIKGVSLPLPDNCSPHLGRVITKMCSFSKDMRYSGMREMLGDLSGMEKEVNADVQVQASSLVQESTVYSVPIIQEEIPAQAAEKIQQIPVSYEPEVEYSIPKETKKPEVQRPYSPYPKEQPASSSPAVSRRKEETPHGSFDLNKEKQTAGRAKKTIKVISIFLALCIAGCILSMLKALPAILESGSLAPSAKTDVNTQIKGRTDVLAILDSAYELEFDAEPVQPLTNAWGYRYDRAYKLWENTFELDLEEKYARLRFGISPIEYPATGTMYIYLDDESTPAETYDLANAGETLEVDLDVSGAQKISMYYEPGAHGSAIITDAYLYEETASNEWSDAGKFAGGKGAFDQIVLMKPYISNSTSAINMIENCDDVLGNHYRSAWAMNDKSYGNDIHTYRYSLQGQYSSFTGSVVGGKVPEGGCTVNIYLDDAEEPAFTAFLDPGTEKIPVDLDLTGKKEILFTIDSGTYGCYALFIDPKFD